MHNITPITIFGKKYNRFAISAITVIAHTSAHFSATIYTDDGAPENAIVREISLTGAEYDAWGDDDDYILDAAADTLGVTLI